MNSVSAIVITCNEERNLARCLRSLYWVQEIVIVDAMSSDATASIAGEFGARVLRRPWPGYAEQRKFALGQATGEWVISLDADEEVSTELADEIIAALRHVPDRVSGYDMPRICNYLGRWIRHGEWYPDRQLRLFRRCDASVTGSYVHEHYSVGGEVRHLVHHIRHYSFDGIRDHARRMHRYSTLMARKLNEGGVPWSTSGMLVEPVRRGWKNYVTLRGCLDGYRGVIITAMIFYYVARTHIKLLLLRANPNG